MWDSATYYYQYGGYGACGNINPDSAIIVALRGSFSLSEISIAVDLRCYRVSALRLVVLRTDGLAH